MGVKSAYRNKSTETPPAPTEKYVSPEPADKPVEPSRDVINNAVKEQAAADEATLRLQRQLAELHQSEQLQRQAMMQHQQMQQQRPAGHAEKLASWLAGGMDEGDYRFLVSHPAMVEHDGLTAQAAHQAAQEGHQRGTDSHRHRTKELFDQHFRPPQTPEFFAPPPPPPPDEHPVMVSAPPSREVSYSGGPREPNPSQVRLSAEQLEIAARSGISPTQYAKNLLLMRKQIVNGERQQ